jgi:glycosyltransferase involved in cell wall biosynthesis
MAELPEPLRGLPLPHPMTWMSVLLAELEKEPTLKLHVIVLRKSISRDFRFERNGVVFHIVKVPGGFRAPSFFWLDTLVIRRVLRKIQPDLVHAWGSEKGAALVASRLGYPYVVTVQGLLTWYQQMIRVHVYDRFTALLERVSLNRARIVTAESAFAVTYLREQYPKLTVRQAEHAPSLLFHRLERRPQLQPIRFITVGTLNHRKGIDLTLKSLERLKHELDFQLIAVGREDGAYLQSLRSGLSADLWKRVEIKPELPPEGVADELSQATVSLLPTRADNSPNVVKEATVAGVPVVATRIGGIPDYVYPEENGLLVTSGDLEGLTSTLLRAARHPLFGRGRVNLSALARCREYLSPEKMGRNFFETYCMVLGQTAEPASVGTGRKTPPRQAFDTSDREGVR